jgi:hypothetical protein
MSGQLNTYGLKPEGPTWKLFEVEGIQVLVSVGYDDDDDSYHLAFEGDVPGLGSATMKLGNGKKELAQQMFDMTGTSEESTAEKIVQTWLDMVGPVIQSTTGMPEGYAVDKVTYDNGAEVRGDGTITRLPGIRLSSVDQDDEED